MAWSWDQACGLQTAEVDAAGKSLVTSYDALCRVARKEGPVGWLASWSYVGLGSPGSQHVLLEQPSPAGSGVASVRTYVDGLGRDYRTVSTGPAPGQEVVTQREWNARGLLALQTLPVYGLDDLQSASMAYEYDGLNRPSRTLYPDGTSTSAEYGG